MPRKSLIALAALAAACSSGGTPSDGGTGPTSGGSSGGSLSYCNGVQVTNPAGAAAYLILYPLAQDVSTCPALVSSVDDAGNPTFAYAGTLAQVGGVWDAYAYEGATPVGGLYPGGCDDVGQGSPPAGGSFTPTDAGSSVAAAVAAALDGGGPQSFYGVVTFLAPWSTEGSGSLYLQDPVPDGGSPTPGSGIDVWVASGAGANLPSTPPGRGDVVLVTEVGWSPYHGVNQFAYGEHSTMTVLGQSTLPPPVSATAAQLAPGSHALDAYRGMRVVDPENFVVSGSCPGALTYSPSGG